MKKFFVCRFVFCIFLAVLTCAPMLFCGKAYYVDFSGITNGDGSLSAPWNNLSSVNSKSFSIGDDVYFKCGTITNRKELLTVDWEGTAADKVIIGSYYINNGSAILGVSGNRPTFDLQKDYPCAGDSMLTSCFYTPIIKVIRKYVVIKNLIVKNSSGGGVIFAGPDVNYPSRQAAFGEINNVFVESTTGISIAIDNMDHFSMINCEVSDAPTTTQRPWPSNYHVRYSNDVVVDGCIIRTSHKEASNLAGNQRLEIKNCVYYAASRVFFNFPGHKGGEPLEDVNIHHNMFYGSYEYGGTLLYFGDEPVEPGGASNIRFHNNIAAAAGTGGTSSAFEYLISFNNCRDAAGNKVEAVWNDILIYNNTFIEMRSAVKSVADSVYTTFNNCQIKNNIFANYFFSDVDFLGADSKPLYVEIDYNLWSRKPHPYLQGSHDPGYPDYTLQSIGILKTSGWENLLYGSISKEDFKVNSNSMALNKGISLDSVFNVDCFGTIRPQGSAWDIGAQEYITQSGSQPPAPEGLTVK